MPTFAVEYAEADTGRTHVSVIDAGSEAEAADFVRTSCRNVYVGSVRDLDREAAPAVAPPSPRELVLAFRDSRDYWKRHSRSVANGVAMGIWFAMLAPIAVGAILATILAIIGTFDR